MKTSTVLKLARPLIKDYEFLCIAVKSVGYRNQENTDPVRNIISERLGKSYTLNSWLDENHGIRSEDMSIEKYNKKIFQTRLAWCDSMIAEFAAKGD